MIALTDNLEGMLKGLNEPKQRSYIIEIYRQIVPGPKGRLQKEGEFKEYVTTGAQLLDRWVFIDYVVKKLEEFGMPVRANYLRDFYSINDEIKGDINIVDAYEE